MRLSVYLCLTVLFVSGKRGDGSLFFNPQTIVWKSWIKNITENTKRTRNSGISFFFCTFFHVLSCLLFINFLPVSEASTDLNRCMRRWSYLRDLESHSGTLLSLDRDGHDRIVTLVMVRYHSPFIQILLPTSSNNTQEDYFERKSTNPSDEQCLHDQQKNQ